jgi:hypothetical protein
LDDLDKHRKKKSRTTPPAAEGTWKAIDTDTMEFDWFKGDPTKQFATIDLDPYISLGSLFRKFMTPHLIRTMWESYPTDTWSKGSAKHPATMWQGVCNKNFVYVGFAVYIRIMGIQNGPKENTINHRPQRNNVQEARAHFAEKYPTASLPGIECLEILMSRFHVAYEHYEKLSLNFQSILSDFGVLIAGDEELLKFFGQSGYIRLAPAKPDKIGLWFYELVCSLGNRKPYMLHIRLHDSELQSNFSVPASDVIKDWALCVRRHDGAAQREWNQAADLCFDAYYATNESRKYLRTMGHRYVCSVKRDNFRQLFGDWCNDVDKPGQWAGRMNELPDNYDEDPTAFRETELAVFKWDRAKGVGQKYSLSNVYFRMTRKIGAHRSVLVPGYDLYKIGFNGCDQFNRELNDRKYPHRTGGSSAYGDMGHIHKFAMACIVHNIQNIFLNLREENARYVDFKLMCCDLADDLVERFM